MEFSQNFIQKFPGILKKFYYEIYYDTVQEFSLLNFLVLEKGLQEFSQLSYCCAEGMQYLEIIIISSEGM